MVGFRAGSRAAVALLALVPATASAEGNCTTVDVDFMPAAQADNSFGLQIVAWLELPDGTYRDTMFITAQTGTYGIGNRPGRFDFNSGPSWPYGRRPTVFPVWAHRHGLSWLQVSFQNDNDNDLSHPFNQSSREPHFCRPLQPSEFDAITCASTVFTDKGVMKPGAQASLYPPRNDLARTPADDPGVDMYGALNPFDAVSQATPPAGTPAAFSWPVPESLPFGDYVMWVEVSREFDMNGTYNPTVFPSPENIPWMEYGEPYRGQPSVLYRLPFSIVDGTESTATTSDYVGYGDPTGEDGNVRPPDSTITTTAPGSGATRLQLISSGGAPYRLRLVSRPQFDLEAPAEPSEPAVVGISPSSASIAFTAPGDDGVTGRPQKYEIRYVAGEELTADRFDGAIPVAANINPAPAGTQQAFTLDGLLPETVYSVGIRAIDDCRNVGPLAFVTFVTPARAQGQVDACFVATAAYGSVMANDVDMLRRFRDAMLRKTVLGELAVETYYTFSPAVANVVGESDLLRFTARDLLAPVVDRVRGLPGVDPVTR